MWDSPDRRLLPHVPDPRRKIGDQRGAQEKAKKVRRAVRNPAQTEHRGKRYLADYKVRVKCRGKGYRKKFVVHSKDISTSGIRLHTETEQEKEYLKNAKRIKLSFRIKPGSMPEGYEMKVRTRARFVHAFAPESGGYDCGLAFPQSLVRYAYKHKGRTIRRVSILALIALTMLVFFMRVESVVYFQFDKLIYLYSIITAAYLLSRYLFGLLYKAVPVKEGYTPPVTIIIPCFNEEEWIQRTILSCLDQEYPPESVEIIVVDDCSNDHSVKQIEALLERMRREENGGKAIERVRFLRQPFNQGKREAMARGIQAAKHDLVVFVDSDSFLEPTAIVNLVQPFRDPKVGGVSGRTDVANTYTNMLTRMQAVRYYISFRIMKAAESYFEAVTCLSGPLSCYRKSVVEQYLDAWLNQSFLGRKATFGDDRSLTNFLLRKHRTLYQDTAVCSTIVPNSHKMFLKQQVRWKRSWLRETAIAASFMWKKEPLMAVSFYFGFVIPLLSPVITLNNLVYIPLRYGFFPKTFLFGLLAMSLLMSVTQLLLRRSRTWFYGIFYCIYHVLVLMWQMPYAWVTFWKSTWGTRMTPEDLLAKGITIPMPKKEVGDTA